MSVNLHDSSVPGHPQSRPTPAPLRVVARTLGGLPPSRWHPSVGAGLSLRLRTNDRTTARLDLGVGRGTFGASVGLGEAF